MMSHFIFAKTLLANTQRSISMEYLDANKYGAYTSSSIIGCNTRKYHGLLVAPINSLGTDSFVFLSSLDESIISNGVEFKLGMHDFGNNKYSPTGNKYIYSYSFDKTICTLFHLGDLILSKELILSKTENRIFIKYSLLSANEGVQICFKPLLAYRNVNDLCQANYNINTSYSSVKNGIALSLYTNYPKSFLQFNRPIDFNAEPLWIKGINYYKEQWRGYSFLEDLYCPGTFNVSLKEGDSVIFTCGFHECLEVEITSSFFKEKDKNKSINSVSDIFKNVFKTFYSKVDAKHTLLKAGFPWFKCTSRSMIVSIPGMTLPFDDKSGFQTLISTFESMINSFISSDESSYKENMIDFECPDILLWYIRAIQLYSIKYGNEGLWDKHSTCLLSIIDFYLKGKHPYAEIHDNGLLYVKGGWNKALTWMNTVNSSNKPITPRSGYVIEMNALWYNSLRFVSELANGIHKYDIAKDYNLITDNVRNSFTPLFWNGTYLFDFVDGDRHEVSVRPNMLMAVALPYSPLDEIQKKMIVDMSTKELLTPKGLRTLSPNSQNYHGWCGGNQNSRMYEEFQGAVYPWLMGMYVDAYFKVYQNKGLDFLKRSMSAFIGELSTDCIGTLPEMYDATQPFEARGGISYLMNVAEISRILDTLNLLKN